MSEKPNETAVEYEDFFATELLRELKEENIRKDKLLHKKEKHMFVERIIWVLTIILIVAGFIWYLNQYDFTSTSESYMDYSAEGVYALVDSEGNCISSDLTYEEAMALMEEMDDGNSTNGEADQNYQESE